MSQAFVNNYDVALTATLGINDLIMQVASTSKLPVLSASNFMLLTIYDLNGVEESNHEVVRAINVTGNQITLNARAVEGTASQFLAGARVGARWTAKAASEAVRMAGTLTFAEQVQARTNLNIQNVSNTTDLAKPVSTAQAQADANVLLAAKAYTDEHTAIEDLHALMLTF